MSKSISNNNQKDPVEKEKKHKEHKHKDKKDKKDEEKKSNTPDLFSGDAVQTGIKHQFNYKDCSLDQVTVYSDRAEVTRKVITTITQEGIQDIVISGLRTNVVENSFRVSGSSGEVTILEVSFDKKFEKKDEKAELSKEQEKKKELEKLDQSLEQLDAQINRSNKEKLWVEEFSSQKISQKKKDNIDGKSNDEVVISLEEATKLIKFYGDELERLDNEVFQNQKNRKTLEEKREKLVKEIELQTPTLGQNLSSTSPVENREVTISFYAKDKDKIELLVSYVITGADWKASYDCRINENIGKEKEDQIQLIYYGSVTNATGEDWKDVKLALSTAAPTSAARPPPLKTLYVKHHYKTFSSIKADYSANVLMAPSSSMSNKLDDRKDMKKGASLDQNDLDYEDDDDDDGQNRQEKEGDSSVSVLTADVQQGSTSQTYEIKRICTIESDKKPHKVTIMIVGLEAKFSYTSIPALAERAYLRAKVKNKSKYLLMAGQMTVFNNNVFVTTSEMPMASTDEEFDIFLGVDDSIKISFQPVKKNNTTSGLLFKTKSELTTHTTTIKNQKNRKISMLVFDQLPKSEDDKIKVKVLNPSELSKEKSSSETIINDFNNVRWVFDVGSQSEKKIVFQYSVDFPSDREIQTYSSGVDIVD